MAPRVKFVGESADMLEYEDDRGNRFSVPKQIARTSLPEQYDQDLAAGFEAFKRAPAEVQESERQRYNELAAITQKRYDAPAEPLPADLRGVTRPRFPTAVPFDGLNSERMFGPTQAGPSLSDRPQVAVKQQVRPNDSEALWHEGMHASAADPTDNDRYLSMSPREREQWRVFSALKHEDAPHAWESMQPAEQFDVDIGEPEYAQRYDVELGEPEVRPAVRSIGTPQPDKHLDPEKYGPTVLDTGRDQRRRASVLNLRRKLGL